MLVTEIKCKATTPIFIAGTETNKPELRAASIKGIMRYIWRAVQCAPDINTLREKEGQLFGNANGDGTIVSPLRLQVVADRVEQGKVSMVPHRDLSEEYDGKGKSFQVSAAAFKIGSTFTVRIITNAKVSQEQHNMYVHLFVLMTILAGFGRRTRKGMGSVVITSITGDAKDVNFSIDKHQDLLPLLNFVSNKEIGTIYKADINAIWSVPVTKPFNYPYIEYIFIWKPISKGIEPIHVTQQIGLSTHKFSNAVFTGTARPRFASSLLMSTVGDSSPSAIITMLNCTKDFDINKREVFLDDLYGRIVR